MSYYWNSQQDHFHTDYSQCNPEYAHYHSNMSYHDDSNWLGYEGDPGYSAYPNQQVPYQIRPEPTEVANSNIDESGPSQLDGNRNNGVKKKSNERNRLWNNTRKNRSHGSDNGVNRTANFFGDGSAEFRPKPRPTSYQNSRFRNNYEDKRSYRSRESYDRSYRNYGRPNNGPRSQNDNYGASFGREDKNWRSNTRKCNRPVPQKMDAGSQRERLEQMLVRRSLECLVCCEKIKHTDKVWSCEQCYHVLHLKCVITWANSSKMSNGWRCPACQNVCSDIPKQYLCFCSKTQEPRPLPGVIPHACGELCEKNKRGCSHKCTILCHPGPCPDCDVMVARSCGCGSTQQTVKCRSDTEIVCNAICNKELECTVHRCKSQCHPGACLPCGESLEQICYCGKVGRRVDCLEEYKGFHHYSCADICGKDLSCGNHKCQNICHEGECEPCPRDIRVTQSCPCGRSSLPTVRSSCLDPIPCCDKICAKILNCGQPSMPHTCKHSCHEGPCPSCPLTTLIRCRCGHLGREIPCPEVITKADDARCEKKCTKKRLCGKHRCNQRCCIEAEHVCPLPCQHLLACGNHRCDRTCHSGRCLPCIETSFEELYCECGANVLYPPIPCGTKPPPCNNPCSRPRACGHEVNHSCHTGSCPPCTVLCKRWCHGKHEQRSAVPCYQEDFSCGLPCSKQLPCGNHKCDKACHLGPCPLPCKQKCNLKRSQCGHSCGAPCHTPPCPETSCKENVPVSCQCGLQKSTRPCIDLEASYREWEMATLKDKMSDLLKEQTVDISDINNPKKRPSVLKILECNEECRVLERNRRLAIGLQIRNPDLSQKLTPRYSDFMRGWAKKDPQFCQKVHDKLTELVHLAKQSKQKSRSHSFESMNRDKRHFVHEYCEHFGCESAAYDMEPNRNIVATAFKDKSWLPCISLLEFIQRENGQRKVPGPVMTKGTMGKSEVVALKLPTRQQQRPSTPPGETIDYFDNPPM